MLVDWRLHPVAVCQPHPPLWQVPVTRRDPRSLVSVEQEGWEQVRAELQLIQAGPASSLLHLPAIPVLPSHGSTEKDLESSGDEPFRVQWQIARCGTHVLGSPLADSTLPCAWVIFKTPQQVSHLPLLTNSFLSLHSGPAHSRYLHCKDFGSWCRKSEIWYELHFKFPSSLSDLRANLSISVSFSEKQITIIPSAEAAGGLKWEFACEGHCAL